MENATETIATGTTPPMAGLTEGRIVHYILPFGPHKGDHRPAIVVRVWSETTVNLVVFLDGSNDRDGMIGYDHPPIHWATSAMHAPATSHEFGTWHQIERA